MTRSTFLTVLLASTILAYVQTNPVTGNVLNTVIIPNQLLEPEISIFQNNLKETWTNVKNTIQEKIKELVEDSSISNDFLNTVEILIHKLKLTIEESIEGSDKPKDPEPSKNELVYSWVEHQKTFEEQYEEMKNSNVQAISDEIKNAIKKTKAAIQIAIDIVRARIENVEKNNDKEIVIEYDDNGLKINDKLRLTWNEFKNQLKEKILNNPKVKDIIEKTNKMIKEIKDDLENIIDAIDKTRYFEEKKEDFANYGWKERSKRTLENLKNKLEENLKDNLNKPKLQAIIEKTNKTIEYTKDTIKKIIESIRNSKQPKNPENEEELKDGGMEDLEFDVFGKTVKEAWNDFKKHVDDKLKKILNNPEVKEIFETLKKEIIKRFLMQLENLENFEFDVFGKSVKETWNDFKKHVDDKLKQILNNPEVKEIFEALKKEIKKRFLMQLENLENFEFDVFGKSVKETWNDFKKHVHDKLKKLLNNPKIKEIIEEGEKAVKQGKNSVKEIIESIHNPIKNIII
ncbi:kinetochore protein ndc-80-like [Vespa crabro]|uniref:kinetochore protein ndc-80-like n=1 Tax=Vespa crabro TaxID=7445 RepID=UPI001F011505|nr:kinetochore protein ndc-80-like [Vespa crabro]